MSAVSLIHNSRSDRSRFIFYFVLQEITVKLARIDVSFTFIDVYGDKYKVVSHLAGLNLELVLMV